MELIRFDREFKLHKRKYVFLTFWSVSPVQTTNPKIRHYHT